jgi:anti-sigma regulatory factor (Ser/Thr protein kinase)
VVLTTVVRRFITDFYDRVLADEDSTSRLALATQELLENAIKYGVEGDTALSIELDRRAGVVRVRTSNRSHPEHIAVLQRRFAEMRDAPDAFKFYQQLLRSTMHETEGSGLGLARIRCEGEMDIDVTVDGNLVGVCAVARTNAQISEEAS